MKRSLILTLAVALFAPVAMMGCGEEAKTETTKKTETPNGSVKETETKKVETTGDAKPDAPK